MSAYPAYRQTDVVLRDGRTVRVRPVQARDEREIVGLLEGLSEPSRYMRFFSSSVNVRREARAAVDVDYESSYGVVALIGPEEHVVGHASMYRIDDERAEVGFTVADDYQGLGLGSILLVELAEHAVELGVPLLEAMVIPENRRMLATFRESGRPVRMHTEPGLITVELPSSLSDAALERFERREQIAARAALAHFLQPSVVAVITEQSGAGTLPGELRSNLLYGGFAGTVHDLAPTDPVPPGVELAVVALEAAALLAAAGRCGAAGVRALTAISTGSQHAVGDAERRELVEICRATGMRLLGPNCLGVLSTDPAVRLNATYGPGAPRSGPLAFMSQSAGIGLAALHRAAERGLGLSALVSVGDRGDISSNDLLRWWEDDEATTVIGLYLESFGNPRKFARLARRVAATTPIVAVKSGRTVAGERAAASHTAGLISASDVNVDALLAQAGVVRTDTVRELFDTALLLATQPLPAGRRVAVVTNANGPGVLCADAAVANGLDVPELDPGLTTALRRALGDDLPVGNPLNLQLVGSAQQYHDAILALGRHPSIDAVCAIHVPTLGVGGSSVGQAVHAAAAQLDGVPLLAVVMLGAHAAPASGDGARVPTYESPEDAMRALGRVARYAEWRSAPASARPVMPAERVEEAAAVVADALRAGPGWLEPPAAARLVGCYGVRLVPPRAAPGPGVELHVGVVTDPLFGPVLGLGVGDPAAEVLRDVAVRITPLTEHDAHDLVRSLRSFPLLEGYGGRRALDIAALERLLLGVGSLVEDHPQVVELGLAPLYLTSSRVLVAGARVRVENVRPAPLLIGRP